MNTEYPTVKYENCECQKPINEKKGRIVATFSKSILVAYECDCCIASNNDGSFQEWDAKAHHALWMKGLV